MVLLVSKNIGIDAQRGPRQHNQPHVIVMLHNDFLHILVVVNRIGRDAARAQRRLRLPARDALIGDVEDDLVVVGAVGEHLQPSAHAALGERPRIGDDLDGVSVHEADDAFFEDIVRGVTNEQRRIDPQIERHLADKWTLARLDATARAILRSAVFELLERDDIPFPVVIDEYVELANAFFDGEEPRFINAVLDAAAHEMRTGHKNDEA